MAGGQPQWARCGHHGCVGVQLASTAWCLAHAAEQAPDAFDAELKRIGAQGTVDARGVDVSAELLTRLLAEEQHWRASRRGRWRTAGWYPPVCRPPESAKAEEAPGVGVVEPARLAALYRELRKGREDAKDEPGAADFYYGECELRRRDPAPPRRSGWCCGCTGCCPAMPCEPGGRWPPSPWWWWCWPGSRWPSGGFRGRRRPSGRPRSPPAGRSSTSSNPTSPRRDLAGCPTPSGSVPARRPRCCADRTGR